MSISMFAVNVEESEEARLFMEQSAERATGPGLHEFFAKWLIFEEEGDGSNITYVIAVNSLFPDILKTFAALSGFGFLLLAYFISAWFGIATAFLFGVSLLASTPFRYLTVCLGLRRYGYTGKIRKGDIDDLVFDILEERCRRRGKGQ